MCILGCFCGLGDLNEDFFVLESLLFLGWIVY